MESKYQFNNIATEWLKSKEIQLKPSSISKYSNILNWYLLPTFSDLDIRKITRNDVRSVSQMLLVNDGTRSQGLSTKTVAGIVSVLKNIFDFALMKKELDVVVINNISIKQTQQPLRILCMKEQNTINKYLFNNLNPCYLGILLSLYTGIRIGEVCALKWKDICIAEQSLYIYQSMQRIQVAAKSSKKTMIIIQSPKSESSIRRIPIPTKLFDVLVPYKKQDDAFLFELSAYLLVTSGK